MPDKQKIILNFSKSAKDYDRHALLQKELADALFQTAIKYHPQKILDIGSGSGYLGDKLARHFPAAEVIGVDLSPEMVQVAKERFSGANLCFLQGDGERLDFTDSSFDMVVSNASFQWMDFPSAAKEARRILKPGGYFIFTTFGPKTLQELRQFGFRVNQMLSATQIKNILGSGFTGKEITTRACSRTFDSIKAVVEHLKNIGAQTAEAAAGQKLKISALKKERGNISVTFEIIHCFATRK